jgi:hypothetical protein
VSDIDGNTPRAQEKIGLVTKSRRKLMAISSDVRGLRDAARPKHCFTLTQNVKIPMTLRNENKAKLTGQR